MEGVGVGSYLIGLTPIAAAFTDFPHCAFLERKNKRTCRLIGMPAPCLISPGGSGSAGPGDVEVGAGEGGDLRHHAPAFAA
jgi:hypothetical protein